jgi:hypothetical protein
VNDTISCAVVEVVHRGYSPMTLGFVAWASIIATVVALRWTDIWPRGT